MRILLLAAFLLLASCADTQNNRKLTDALAPYSACRVVSGPELVEITPITMTNSSRSVTVRHGEERTVLLEDGVRLMYAYPGTDFFANVKVELLPGEKFATEVDDLVRNFDYLLSSSPDNLRNYALKPTMNGLRVFGQDRTKLEGGVLGLYLLIDDSSHVVTTIYLLNQEPEHRKFANIEEYAKLRDHFLDQFTRCAQQARSQK